MALVRKAQVLDRAPEATQFGDHFLRILAQHAHVVAAMHHQQRRGDAIDLRDRRVGEHLGPVDRVADVAIEALEEMPVAPERRPVLDHPRPVRHADQVDAASIGMRFLDQLSQHREAAEAGAHDRNAGRIGNAAIDRPLHAFGDVALARAVVFARAGPHEVAAVAAGAAVVDLEHRVAAVGQELVAVVAGCAPSVAHAPGPAVDAHHHRHRPGGSARPGDVAVDRQAVGGLEVEGFDRREQAGFRTPLGGEPGELAAVAVEQHLDRLVAGDRAQHQAPHAFAAARRAGKHGLAVQPLPFLRKLHGSGDLRAERLVEELEARQPRLQRIAVGLADQRRVLRRIEVDLAAFGQHPLPAAGEVELDQRGFVAPDVAHGPEPARRQVDAVDEEQVEGLDVAQVAPAAFRGAPFESDIRAVLGAELAHPAGQLLAGVDQPADDPAVGIALRHFAHAAGGGVGLEQVHAASVAAVAGEEEAAAAGSAARVEGRAHAWPGRDRPGLAVRRPGIDDEELSVLVAREILDVGDMAAIGQPRIRGARDTRPGQGSGREGRDARAVEPGRIGGFSHGQADVGSDRARPEQSLAVRRECMAVRVVDVRHEAADRNQRRKPRGALGFDECRCGGAARACTKCQNGAAGRDRSGQPAQCRKHPVVSIVFVEAGLFQSGKRRGTTQDGGLT
ncbi:conserved hypothetical protein [Burkholderiales bacterium 8X]|nr:conserved hypothetical protein [Burkholderiales bacterium 8X]